MQDWSLKCDMNQGTEFVAQKISVLGCSCSLLKCMGLISVPLLLIQLPADVPKKAANDAPSAFVTWETWLELLPPSSHLTTPQLLQGFGD